MYNLSIKSRRKPKMKLELTNSRRGELFKDIKVGETFYQNGILFLRIEVDDVFTNAKSHNGLAVSLETGRVIWFDDYEAVAKADVKVVNA